MKKHYTTLFQKNSKQFSFWLALLTGIIMSLAVFGVWNFMNDRGRKHINSLTDYASRVSELLIVEDINNRLEALNRIVQRWPANGGISQQNWELDAARYISDMPGFQAIEWADASLHIRWIVPFDKNKSAQNLDLSLIEPERSAIMLARENSKLRLTGPFELSQGRLAITVYMPVMRNNQFDGVIIGVLRLDQWLEAVFTNANSTEYQTRIFIGGQQVYQLNDYELSKDNSWVRRSDFKVHGLGLTTMISPTNEFLSVMHLHVTTLILIVGLLLSVLFGLVVYQALASRIRTRELHAKASQLSVLFQNMPGLAYRVSLESDLRVEFVSEGCQALTGYQPHEFVDGRVPLKQLMHPDDFNQNIQMIRHAIDTDEMYDLEYRIIMKSGEVRWVLDRGRAISQHALDRVDLEGFVIDITNRKLVELKLTKAQSLQLNAEETLRLEHERLSVIIEHAHIGIVTYRFGQAFISVNRAFCSMTGYTVDELKSMTVEDLTHPDDLPESERLASKAKSGEIQQYTQEKRYTSKGGDIIHVQIVNTITHDAAGNIDLVIGLVEDLTPRLAAETEANQHLEQLAHVSRLNVLGEMASGIAHEVNQPLAAISLFAQAGKHLLKARNYDRMSEVMDKLSQQAQRAGAIIERIQMMTRRRESKVEMTNCRSLITEAVQLAEADARIRDIEIKMDIANELSTVTVDAIQIQQVVLNLLRNGMEAMESINCRNGNTIILQGKQSENGDVKISIIDSGCGISQAVEEILFSPFLSTKDSGMGMGLSISRTIIIAHGGQLDFFNNKSGGAAFYFNLPATLQDKLGE